MPKSRKASKYPRRTTAEGADLRTLGRVAVSGAERSPFVEMAAAKAFRIRIDRKLAGPGWGQYGSVGDRYRIPGGWTVEVLKLGVGERLRIRHYGYYIADATACRSPDAA